jgi:PIN domain nuclease of toxin-antitoxin system
LRLLLDSNALLWWLTQSQRLRDTAKALISSPENQVYVSPASVWELCIKASLGKLQIPHDISAQMIRHNFELLAITNEHALGVIDLPLIHKDPFDRLLIAQAMTEGLTIITSDEVFEAYSVPVVRA